MKDETASGRACGLSDALQHLEAAIEILDRIGAPAHVAAHVDLAACQLKDIIASERQITSLARHATK